MLCVLLHMYRVWGSMLVIPPTTHLIPESWHYSPGVSILSWDIHEKLQVTFVIDMTSYCVVGGLEKTEVRLSLLRPIMVDTAP